MIYALLTLVSFVSWFYPQVISAATECAPVVIKIVESADLAYTGPRGDGGNVRAFYRVPTQTIYIESDTSMSDILHELGHHHGATCLDDWSEEYARSWGGRHGREK